MTRLIVFSLASAFFVYISRKSLIRPQSHGFHRFFAWESILALALLNEPRWFDNPFSPRQLLSWLLLGASIFLVAHGVYLLRVLGKPDHNRADPELLHFEKTSALVTSGIYGYIRHPLYSSLLFLAWGAFLKQFSWAGLLLVCAASLFLLRAAHKEEVECLKHFGAAYEAYIRRTKRMIPFVL